MSDDEEQVWVDEPVMDDAGGEPDDELDAETQVETEAETEVDAELDAETQPETEAEPETQPETQPVPEPTGSDEVDAIVGDLARLDELEVHEHVAEFENAHQALRRALDAGGQG